MNYSNELYHYGILGMKWGVRRYQNKDGSLTNAGKKRLAKYSNKKDKTSIRESFEQERSKLEQSKHSLGDKYRLGSKYIENYAESTLKSMNMKVDDNAIHETSKFLKRLQLKKDIDAQPEINELRQEGYKISHDYWDARASKRMSNGLDLEIVISNNDYAAPRLIDDVSNYVKSTNTYMEKNFESITKDVSKDLYKVYGQYTEDWTGKRITESEFTSRVSPYSVQVTEHNGRRLCELGFDDDDMFGGHSLDVEFDLDSKDRIYYHSMNG